jgi:hypothetical protein
VLNGRVSSATSTATSNPPLGRGHTKLALVEAGEADTR